MATAILAKTKHRILPLRATSHPVLSKAEMQERGRKVAVCFILPAIWIVMALALFVIWEKATP